MRRGQLFTLDLFNAYAIFLVVMLIITLLIASVFSMSASKQQYDELLKVVLHAEDYLTYSSDLNDVPYKFNKEKIDTFLALPDDTLRDKLGIYGYNYSIKITQIVGNTVRAEAGTDTNDYDMAVSLSRVVMYDNTECLLVVKVWKRE
ncbi:MAG: hypothetical protein J7K68_02420 [Candidatus Diapherotrites archaeon]|nr:hypothetical protein [Candidatus Diapherotrites archaeon]